MSSNEKMLAALRQIASGVGPLGARLGYDQMREIAQIELTRLAYDEMKQRIAEPIGGESQHELRAEWSRQTGIEWPTSPPREIVAIPPRESLSQIVKRGIRELARSVPDPPKNVTKRPPAAKPDANRRKPAKKPARRPAK